MKRMKNPAQEKRRAPRLNERILSSLSRRWVAARAWHDLEIGGTKVLSAFRLSLTAE